MEAYKMTQKLTEPDLQYLNKKYNRFSMGPAPTLRWISYFILIYTLFVLYMVYLQFQLFMTGTFVFMDLFAFRLISGVIGLLFVLGKLNPLILKIQIHFFPKTCLSERHFSFLKLRFETDFNGKKQIFAYGEIIKCDFLSDKITLQMKNQNYMIREQDMTHGTFSAFVTFMKGQKNNFNQDHRLARKEMLKNL